MMKQNSNKGVTVWKINGESQAAVLTRMMNGYFAETAEKNS